MKIDPFLLERFFVPYEFTVDHVLCASDCATLTVAELMQLDPTVARTLHELPLSYSPMDGLPELREQIADLHESVAEDGVVVTTGAGSAIELTCLALLERGDSVVAVAPGYQAHRSYPEFLGCNVSTVPLADTPDGWELDLDRVARATRGGARAILICFPHNPTGHLPDRSTFEALVEIAARAGAHLISDEVFRWTEHADDTRLPSATLFDERAVALGSMSKSFGLPGLRIGWIATRSRELLDGVMRFLDYAAKDASSPGQLLAAAALRKRDTILERNRRLALDNLARLDRFVDRNAALVSWHRPRAGVVGAMRLAVGSSEDLFRTLVAERGVLVAPGPLFGLDPAYFRIGFGHPDFPAGLERLEAHLRVWGCVRDGSREGKGEER